MPWYVSRRQPNRRCRCHRYEMAVTAAAFIILTASVVCVAVCSRLVADETGDVRFETLDVFIDSGDETLAAYQFELLLFRLPASRSSMRRRQRSWPK